MKIHAIQTGTVAVTTAWREGVGQGKRRLVNTIRDREWTEPLPIYAFAIEHPEGVIVVDSGEAAGASQPGYFPGWHPGVRAFREWVEPEQEIGPQLERLGISPSDARWIVMTHLHTDHAGGLHHFPDNEILVTRTELEFASGLTGRLRGYVANTHWPAWFKPTMLELEPDPLGPFSHSLRLTKAGDVTLVPLPGHTPGQIGVLIDEGDQTVFLAGDSSYTQDLMLRGKPDGVGADDEAERLTHERIRAYAAAKPDRLPRRTRPGDRRSARPARPHPAGRKGGRRMISFSTEIGIRRPRGDVFAYVSDPGNFPAWNSAVEDVRPTSPAANNAGSTYAMTRRLPTGAATNQLEIVASEQPHEFAIRTTSGPTPFRYRYRFAVENGGTIVHLDAQVELDGVAALVPQLARLAVKHGVDDNLATLKQILEDRRR